MKMVNEEPDLNLATSDTYTDDDYPFWLRAPFRLLTDVTQFRKVDPWDLEIADLITNFVEMMKKYEDINFPVLGRAILSAAILYRSKVTDLIKIIEASDEHPEDFEAIGFDIPEIAPSYHISQRPVTFNELVYAFEGLLKQESKYKHRLMISKRKALIEPLKIPPKPIKVIDEESTKIAKLKKDIYNRLVKLHGQHSRPITFEELILPNSNKIAITRTFLCILFLGFELKALLFQEEDLGTITLVPIRDNEEEFLGDFEKIIEEKLKDGIPEEGVTVREITEEEEFLEADQYLEDDLDIDETEDIFVFDEKEENKEE
jgi:chromatin segregation and condensation protein Rec8/ScpA/Scc1 (kleisin family)